MEPQYSGEAQIIQYNIPVEKEEDLKKTDEKTDVVKKATIRARPIPFGEGENAKVYYPEKNDDGFPIIKGPKDLARLLITCHPERYRLYKTVPLDAQRINPGTGAVEWIVLYPWFYTKERVADGVDPDNDEQKYKTVIHWHEDKEGVTAGKVEKSKRKSQSEILNELKEKAAEKVGMDAVDEVVLDFRVEIEKPKGIFSTEEFPQLVKRLNKIIDEG